MEYHYHEKNAWNQSGSILDYVQQINVCNQNNLVHIEELLELVNLTGMEELEGYLKHSIEDLEKSQLWIKMALSVLAAK